MTSNAKRDETPWLDGEWKRGPIQFGVCNLELGSGFIIPLISPAIADRIISDHNALAVTTEALESALNVGHNLDCMFCGFKDKALAAAIAKLRSTQGASA